MDTIPLPFLVNSITINPDSTSKYPNGYFKNKRCRFCKNQFTPVAPSHHYCSNECAIKAGAERYINRNYGITLDTYYEMYIKQDGKCYICKGDGFSLKECMRTTLVIDHDHKTGKVRGLLCPNCNRALGLLKDSVEYLNRAKEYLEKEHYTSDSTKLRELKQSSNKPKTKNEVFNIYKDIFENKLHTRAICKKYNITKETKHNIQLGKYYKEYMKEYRESATTIQ